MRVLHQKPQLVKLDVALQEELIPADKEAKLLETKYHYKGRSLSNDMCLLHFLDNPFSFGPMRMWIAIVPNMCHMLYFAINKVIGAPDLDEDGD
ncbi:hypothetical protein B296_00029007 [Ensete ventricosum]|uniref:Uncharacterized protein n=1 Tax=Ensete ventricosum TaxID=4639 RepID=A0A426Y6Z1_ENSVE|nr:hypothetical protein B296_00029007 [Ensete ventricosum]